MKHYDGRIEQWIRGEEVMAGIREERKFRKMIGAREKTWIPNDEWDRWDRRVNWTLLVFCACVMAAGFVALLPIL